MREGPEIAFTFPFLIYLVGLWGMSDPLVCQHLSLQHRLKRGWGEGVRPGRLSGEDGISL